MIQLGHKGEPAQGRKFCHDAGRPGSTLCVTARGARIFYLCRSAKGRPVKFPLGKFPEITVDRARKQARKLIGETADGRDPQAARVEARQEPIGRFLTGQ